MYIFSKPIKTYRISILITEKKKLFVKIIETD